jgi:hypothetical protein
MPMNMPMNIKDLKRHDELQEREKLKTFFARVTKEPETHARFLNTLSFLEYVGSRKIMKSQPESRVTADLLAHIAEEVRHAQLFKRMALALSDGRLVDYSAAALWEGEGAWRYFQGVDQAGPRLLQHYSSLADPWACYLLTTYGIETRASLAYEVYLDFAGVESHRKLVSGILKEEEVHLSETMAELARAFPDSRPLKELAGIEADLFWTWIGV